MKKRDLTGITFNMLTAKRFDHRGRHGLSFYWFECECGNEKVLCGTDVSSGKTKSCGCFHNKWPLPQTLPIGRAACNSLFHSYKSGAKSRGFSFELSMFIFEKLTKHPCTYCGALPEKEWTGTNKAFTPYVYNGLDRVENSEGRKLCRIHFGECCSVLHGVQSSQAQYAFRAVHKVDL